MPILSPARIVLIMSDEGLQVYIVGSNVKHIEFIPWETEFFSNHVEHVLRKKCGGKPVVVFNDMVEQHYRKERIPKVGIGDRANVIKSRLSYVFPNSQIRAALKLDKKNNISADAPGDPYLFAAIPKSELFNKTFSSILASGVRLIGFFLLPVEGTNLIDRLSKKINKENETKSVWTIFIGQQSSGGLRQIVTRNGELALTRMTPIIDTDVEPRLWANEVSEELDATMSYVGRFGYKKEDGLDIIIISNTSTHADLQNIIKIEADLHLMTSRDAADMLGVKIGMPSDLRYTDPLYAAYMGKKSKFLLPMQSNAIDKLVKPRQVAGYVVIGLCLALAYVGFISFQNFSKYVAMKDNLYVTQQQIKTQEKEFKIQADKMKELGFDLLMVDSALENYYELNRKKVNILDPLEAIAISLGVDLTISDFRMNILNAPKKVDEYGYEIKESAEKKEILREIIITLEFPSTIRPEEGVRQIENLVSRLSQNMPEFKVEIAKQVADLSYSGNVTGGTSVTDITEKSSLEDYSAEIKIMELQL